MVYVTETSFTFEPVVAEDRQRQGALREDASVIDNGSSYWSAYRQMYAQAACQYMCAAYNQSLCSRCGPLVQR